MTETAHVAIASGTNSSAIISDLTKGICDLTSVDSYLGGPILLTARLRLEAAEMLVWGHLVRLDVSLLG